MKTVNWDINMIKRFSQSVYYFVLYSSIGLPLVMINKEFIRYFRSCNMLIYMTVGILVSISKMQKKYGWRRIVPLGKSGKAIGIDKYYCIVILDLLLWIVMYSPNHIIYDFFMYNGMFN